MKREKRSGGKRGRGLTTTPAQAACRLQIPNAKSQIPNPGGFTLVELLVVIAVIALLMGILLPVLGRVRRQARSLACQSNLREWGLTLHAYAAENDGKLPMLLSEDGVVDGMVTQVVLVYQRDSNDLLLCPTATRLPEDGSYMGSTFRAWREQLPPGISNPYVTGSYGSNDDLGTSSIRFPPDWARRWSTVDVKGAACIPAFFDCATTGFQAPAHERTDGIGSPPPYPDCSDQGSDFTHWICMNRHNADINMAFLDATVRKVGLKELWTLKWHRKYKASNCWTKAGGVQAEEWPKWMRGFKDY